MEHVAKTDADGFTWRDYQLQSVSSGGSVATVRGPLELSGTLGADAVES